MTLLIPPIPIPGLPVSIHDPGLNLNGSELSAANATANPAGGVVRANEEASDETLVEEQIEGDLGIEDNIPRGHA